MGQALLQGGGTVISREEFFESVKEKRCLVIGDIILDKYIFGDVNRISPEAPIPVVQIAGERYAPGGAANVASTVAACGVKTILCGSIGKDPEAERILDFLSRRNIRFDGIRSQEHGTITKVRVTGQVQQMLRLDYENTRPFDEAQERELLERALGELRNVHVVIVSDYGKGVCTEEICTKVISAARSRGVPVLVDPKRADWSRYAGASVITPNFKEFEAAVGKTVENSETPIEREGLDLIRKYRLGSLLVTRSQYGMIYLAEGKAKAYPAKAQEVFDVSGAGDTVISVLAAFFAAGTGHGDAVKISNLAAAISVSRSGTYVVAADEIFDWLEADACTGKKGVVSSYDELGPELKKWRKSGAKIVFTNGCFDILHRGHVEYLQKAKALGDYLIVGVNTNRSVRALKGVTRPVNDEKDRAFLLSSLRCVDRVVFFDDDTPYELIKMVAPDILVKGGDYRVDEVVGREFAKETVIMSLVEGYSTTQIIARSTAVTP